MNIPSKSAEPDRVPFRTVLISMVALWSTYFLFASARSLLVGLDFTFEILGTRLLVTLFGVLVTLGLWFVLRAFDLKALWKSVAVVILLAIPGAVLIAHFNVQAFAPINERLMEEELRAEARDPGNILDEPDALYLERRKEEMRKYREPRSLEYWRYVSDVALGRYFLLLSWGALYMALLAGAQARAAERREAGYRAAARAAELRSLRYQVNPHFLFNTLNSLSALILTGKNERAEAMVDSIANFYRQSLTSEPTADVSLDEEFELQRHYLDIESFRFPERLRVQIDLPENLADARVPGMILQPLVENSVKYAVAESTRPVTIRISAREEFERLVITVEDNGPTGSGSSNAGHGIGLTNVRQRIEAAFGSEATVASGPIEGGYATHIRIPLVRGRPNER